MIYRFTEVLNDLVNYFLLGDILLLEDWKQANHLSDDLAMEFTTNESGDRIFAEGIVIPMTGIENYPYTILFNLSGDRPELCKERNRLQLRKSGYSLKVDHNMLMLFTWPILEQFTPEKVKDLISYYRVHKKPMIELANGWYHIEILGGETLQDGDYEPTFEFVIQPATNEEATINADMNLALKLQALLISETYPYRRWKGDHDMDLLKQCQQWFEQDEAQKVIDTLEAIPAEERTPELDSELAKAYIAVAHIGEREPFEKALELLAPHEEYFAEDHCWNYRIALAYYCLDEEGPALRYFEKALKARPGDKDTQEYINDCRRRLSLPRFEKNFRERTQEAWAAFSQIEAELRQIIDTDETHQRGEELVEKCGNALKTALRDTSFELGFNGEKHELILSPEGLRSRLFPLVYFQKQAPESVLEHWNIWVGRQL